MTAYRLRIGSARPSHLMYTSGVGALIDLPRLSVLVRGLNEWNHTHADNETETLSERRLLAAVQAELGPQVVKLKPAPHTEPGDGGPTDPSHRVGVPVLVFPQWLRCTYCNELAPVEPNSSVWHFDNSNPYRPDEAGFTHALCTKKGRKPLAVAARFALVCRAGHLDDFPYREFGHGGTPCQPGARLRMTDFVGNSGPNVRITCVACGAMKNMSNAAGRLASGVLPQCRGRHPHLSWFSPTRCAEELKLLVIGASNQWFPDTLSALAIPSGGASELAAEVARLWDVLDEVPSVETLTPMLKYVPQLAPLRHRDPAEIMAAVAAHRTGLESGAGPAPQDLTGPEWEVFTSASPPPPSRDFTLHRPGMHVDLGSLFGDVVAVERLRVVKAFIGFTRLDPPDPTASDVTLRAPLVRAGRPTWVPASEVRGEGIFLRLPEDLVRSWESHVTSTLVPWRHFESYQRFRKNRYSGRDPNFDPAKGWPGPRFIAVHTLSHLLIRRIAMECGYSSASIAERIYARGEGADGKAGILLYTSAPDSEGTLGGLVALAEPDMLRRIVGGALDDARRCSSDPLCAERLPVDPEDFLHGAACHVCLFISETSCERGNRFLDRRFLVDIDIDNDPKLVLTPDGL